jgi:hypothetical protein
MDLAVLDEKYISVLLKPLRVCARYRPSLGQSGKEGLTLDGFEKLYGADPLYHWIGLDSALMYAAHKAAGGMTSVYRQLGAGCEGLFREIVADALGLTKENLAWGYDVVGQDGKTSHLELDVRIDFSHIEDAAKLSRVKEWVDDAAESLGISPERRKQIKGAVFEVRQGYKSADAKRQNADMRSAVRSLNDGYLFVVAVISSQISYAVLRRYRNSQMVVLVGDLSGNPIEDNYEFFDKAIGYSLGEFFNRNSDVIRAAVAEILERLLSPA